MIKNIEDVVEGILSEKQLNESDRSQYASKLIYALQNYAKAASALSSIWVDAQGDIEDDEWALEVRELPFTQSFDEHSDLIDEWVEKCIPMLRKIK